MIRQTSIEAYQTIRESGLLSRRRLEAYDILFNHGPMTAQELDRKAGSVGLWKRLSELEAVGVVATVGERDCKVTNMNAILWDVTDKLPIKFEKPKRVRCPHCNGQGFIEHQQVKFNI